MRLTATSRSLGVYSWNNPGVSPSAAATSSSGSCIRVDATIGTPVRAAARAVCRSPWKSCEQMPITPIGHRNSGDASSMPNSEVRQVALVGAVEHPRDQAPAVERLDVGALRALVAGAAGDVGQDPRGQRLGGLALQAVEVDGVLRDDALQTRQVDLQLVVAVLLRHVPLPLPPARARSGP